MIFIRLKDTKLLGSLLSDVLSFAVFFGVNKSFNFMTIVIVFVLEIIFNTFSIFHD